MSDHPMSTKLPLDGRIKTAAQLATRARIFYDIWWFYEGAGTRPRILSTMNDSEFFRFDSHAHFVALIVHLASLLSRSDSVNFSTLVTEAKASGDFPPEAITEAEAILHEVQELSPKVAILRGGTCLPIGALHFLLTTRSKELPLPATSSASLLTQGFVLRMFYWLHGTSQPSSCTTFQNRMPSRYLTT